MNSDSEFDLKMSSENFDNNKKSVFKSINDIDNIGHTLDSLSDIDSDVDDIVSPKNKSIKKKSIRKNNKRSVSQSINDVDNISNTIDSFSINRDVVDYNDRALDSLSSMDSSVDDIISSTKKSIKKK